MSKSLSNGTLSLRFMQNALRRQQLQEVEVERAEVKDEGKWEVGQQVKEAWGIGQGTQASDPVSYESSYLPFIFSAESDDATSQSLKPLGRRMFNKTGRDVSKPTSESQSQHTDNHDEPPIDDDEPAPEGNAKPNDDTRVIKGRKYRVHANPMPLSSLSMDRRSLKGFDTLDEPNKKGPSSKSAREAIFSSSGVGTDLRSARKTGDEESDEHKEHLDAKQMQKLPNASTPPVFLKPSGVDDPVIRGPSLASGSKTSPRKPSVPEIIDGARKKRSRDLSEPEGEGKKKKKKKNSALTKKSTDVE
ncbi:hypothetical protein AN958_05396 [Leucoagaricus sp. SymC.cos]|nr:hypothetical protein AN958_05396 [Leucoagaricus sp. SymC.cos]